MTWLAAPKEVRDLAEKVLTTKQLEAYQLELQGHSLHHMAFLLNISRSTLRDRLKGAHKKMADALKEHGIVWEMRDAA